MKHVEMIVNLEIVANSPATLRKVRIKDKAFKRKRGMQFSEAVSFLLDMRKTSLQTRLNEYYKKAKGGKVEKKPMFARQYFCLKHIISEFHNWLMGKKNREDG